MANINDYSTPNKNWRNGQTLTGTAIAYEEMLRKQQELEYYYRKQQQYYGNYNKKYCRLCGEEINLRLENKKIELGDLIDTCSDCTGILLDKIFKDLIGDKKEYCKKCLYHIKACQCKEKKKLDNLKQ